MARLHVLIVDQSCLVESLNQHAQCAKNHIGLNGVRMEKQTYADWMRERNEILFDHECPKCGWNALSNKGIDEGCCEVVHAIDTIRLLGKKVESRIKCTCPNCNTEFEYFDGSP